jgi:hypothetical protein
LADQKGFPQTARPQERVICLRIVVADCHGFRDRGGRFGFRGNRFGGRKQFGLDHGVLLCFSRLIATCKGASALLKPGTAKAPRKRGGTAGIFLPEERSEQARKFRGATFCGSRRGRYTGKCRKKI